MPAQLQGACAFAQERGKGRGECGVPLASSASKTYGADYLAAQRLARIALLSAIALILSYVETMIPLPTALPGVKLGLANVAVVVALFCFDARTAAAVAVAKVLASGFLFGSPVMLAYSLGGTALAFASMALMKQINGISVVVVSMASAIFHNVGQIVVACVLLSTPAVVISLPPLAVAACVTGALTGCVAAGVLGEGSPVLIARFSGSAHLSAGGIQTQGKPQKEHASFSKAGSFGVYREGSSFAHRLDARAKIVFVIAYFVAAFLADDAVGFACIAAAAALSLGAARMGAGQAFSALRPFRWIIALVVVVDVLFVSAGQALASVGPVSITVGGIELAAESILRFCCLMLGTAALMRTTSPTDLTEGVRCLLSPLAKAGVNTENGALALGMTFHFIPLFAEEFVRIKAAQESRLACFSGGIVRRLASYVSVFVPLFANAFRRADGVALAVLSRGFGSKRRSSLRARCMGKADWLVVAFSVAFAVAIVFA